MHPTIAPLLPHVHYRRGIEIPLKLRLNGHPASVAREEMRP